METLFNQHPFFCLLASLIFLGSFLLLVYIFIQGAKNAKFDNDCHYLEELIYSGKDDFATYNEAVRRYCELDCKGEYDHNRKSVINKLIKLKYRRFVEV